MKLHEKENLNMRCLLGTAALLGALVPGPAVAGGVMLYEVGTADVGLASAGWGARAQDASTVLTNPAGMTRLEGTQLLVGLQALYADLELAPDEATSPGLGDDGGGNPVGWFPGGGAYVTYALSERFTLGLGAAGTFGM